MNYDLLIEYALEKLRVPYFDGFVGALNARFQTELVEAIPQVDTESMPSFFVRLWKLHGSVNWAWNTDKQIVRIGQPVPEGRAAAIYPSDTKYEESRRVPFVVLQDRFRQALHEPDTLMLIAGYSFSDDHLNEQIFDAATRRERSEFVVFAFSEIPDSLLDRAAITPNLQVVSDHEAIIGCVRADWADLGDGSPEIWCEGRFLLSDFKHLSGYLARSSAHGMNRRQDFDTVRGRADGNEHAASGG